MVCKKTFKSLNNDKGASLLVATMIIVAVGLTGLKIVDISAKESTNSNSDMLSRVAEAGAQSGIETALFDLENGLDPSKSFALDTANITVTTDPQNSTVNVEGLVANGLIGNVKRNYQINAKFSKDNIELNVDGYTNGNSVEGLSLTKSDTKTDILESITISWNDSNCAKGITCDDNGSDDEDEENDEENCHEIPESYEPYSDPDHANKILICHNGNTLSVSENAWDHQGHRCHEADYLGACLGDPTATVEEDAPQEACDADDLSEEDLEDLNNCSVSNSGNSWNRIVLQGTTIYQSGSIPDASATDKASGEEAMVLNANLSAAGTYNINAIDFENPIDDGTWITIRIKFADQSYIEKRFQVFANGEQVDAEAEADPVVQGSDGDFEEDGGQVIISDQDDYVLTVGVLAVEITCGTKGTYIPVTIDIAKNGTYSSAFGGSSVSVGQSDTRENLQTQNSYKIRATASLNSCKNYSATVESTSNMVYSLVDGDAVPNTWDVFGGQQSVREVLASYIDNTGHIQLESNQVIMLYEFGSTTNNSSADYQDLVLLVTVDRN